MTAYSSAAGASMNFQQQYDKKWYCSMFIFLRSVICHRLDVPNHDGRHPSSSDLNESCDMMTANVVMDEDGAANEGV